MEVSKKKRTASAKRNSLLRRSLLQTTSFLQRDDLLRQKEALSIKLPELRAELSRAKLDLIEVNAILWMRCAACSLPFVLQSENRERHLFEANEMLTREATRYSRQSSSMAPDDSAAAPTLNCDLLNSSLEAQLKQVAFADLQTEVSQLRLQLARYAAYNLSAAHVSTFTAPLSLRI